MVDKMASPDRTTAVQSVKIIYNIRQMSLGHSANKVLSQFWADSTLLFFKQMMHKNDTKSFKCNSWIRWFVYGKENSEYLWYNNVGLYANHQYSCTYLMIVIGNSWPSNLSFRKNTWIHYHYKVFMPGFLYQHVPCPISELHPFHLSVNSLTLSHARCTWNVFSHWPIMGSLDWSTTITKTTGMRW